MGAFSIQWSFLHHGPPKTMQQGISNAVAGIANLMFLKHCSIVDMQAVLYVHVPGSDARYICHEGRRRDRRLSRLI